MLYTLLLLLLPVFMLMLQREETLRLKRCKIKLKVARNQMKNKEIENAIVGHTTNGYATKYEIKTNKCDL